MLKRFLFFLTFASACVGNSQLSYLNPFSSYGIGNQLMPTDAVQAGMGGTSIAFADSTMISYLNSANNASLTTSYPLFSIGVNGKYSSFTEGNASYSRAYVNLDHMIFAVPFKKIFGISFGLAPYARRGYEFQNKQEINGDTVEFDYAGSGSISKAFTGLSVKLLNSKKAQISIGSNLGYLFGTVTNSRLSSVANAATSGLALQSDRLQSFHYDFSLSVNYHLNENNRIQLNAFYEPSQKLTGNFADELFAVKFNSTTLQNEATLVSSLNTSAIFNSAASLRIGANYTTSFKRNTRKNKTFDSELTFVGEYNMTNFSDFDKDLTSSFSTVYTSDYSRMSFGVQYTPNVGYFRTINPTGFLNRMKYRAGAYTSNLPYSHQGEAFKEFGTTFGIGIPLANRNVGNAFSSINIGVDLGKRTNTMSGALNENYIGFNIGIIIAPSKADSWFRKVKLD